MDWGFGILFSYGHVTASNKIRVLLVEKKKEKVGIGQVSDFDNQREIRQELSEEESGDLEHGGHEWTWLQVVESGCILKAKQSGFAGRFYVEW